MMSRPSGNYGSDRSGTPDAIAEIANGMRDAQMVGLGLLNSVAAFASSGAMGALPMGGMRPDFFEFGGERTAGNLRRAATQLVDIAPYWAEAATISMVGNARYAKCLVELAGRLQCALMQAGLAWVTGQMLSTPEADTVLVEEMRAYLREVGELAVLGARQLERELALAGETLAQAVAPSDPHAPYQRIWAAKA
jgi:hypothetical protein